MKSQGMRFLLALLRWAATLAFLPFVAWLFLFRMPLSGLHALLGLLSLAPRPRWGRLGPPLTAIIWVSAPASILWIGLYEYAGQASALHCRALAASGRPTPDDCDPAELSAGRSAMAQGQPVFSATEQLGVLGVNAILAGSAWLAGFPEIAQETMWLAGGEYAPELASAEARRAQCHPGKPNGTVIGRTLEGPTDFVLRSAHARQVVASLRDELLKGGTLRPNEQREAGPARLIWRVEGADTDSDYYGALLMQDSMRVPLALVTPDSEVRATATGLGDRARIDLVWTGTIAYPADGGFDLVLPDWILRGRPRRVLRVSEASFCGLQMDNVMVPYALRYTWTLYDDDPRLSDQGRQQSERGLRERALRLLLGG